MMTRVLLLGGYGNFGSHIARKLAFDANLQLIIAGRSESKAREAVTKYKNAPNPPEYAVLDIEKDFAGSLQRVRPQIVIHTSGPFQGQGYAVAEACIDYGCHYIDLADGRDFVAGIGALDQKAKAKGVAVISGASSVPCLTSGIIDKYAPLFQKITALDYGITTAQRTNTGLATTEAVLGYCGKSFQCLTNGRMTDVYGWQGLTLRRYPELGWRFLGLCDVPDLALFPVRYPDLQTIRFRAGLEISFVHLSLWALSWLVRARLISSLKPLAGFLLKSSRLLDPIGSDRSGFHMEITGTGADGQPKTAAFYLVAKSGHGPFIPCIPSILCTRMLAESALAARGAMPCMGLISLDQYLAGMADMDIRSTDVL